MPKPKPISWFISKIGKQVIRSKGGSCTCPTCQDAKTLGFTIASEAHAKYLFDCQGDLGCVYGAKK